ncbi:unnamed protein product [Spirodela intermedia]|uniref:Late embryogenesis abundant protein LEA-2 subgroup domain-containing protein n=1 Tax=Spirodela intermedia TaxID=51605 RepID=A0A7I8KI55_SPIIN|nr:unnamed protein product [Spirodela intermedia]
MENERKPVVTGYPTAAVPPIYTQAGAQPLGQPYPYPPPLYFPPPRPPSGPYYAPSAAYGGNGGSLFVRRLIIISIVVFLAFGFATLVLWLVLRPNLPLFAISSASVSSFNVSGGQQFSAKFNLSISVRNPNRKMGILYDKIEARVLYQSETLSETSLAPFYLEKENSTVVPASFESVAKYLEANACDGIARSRSSNGGVVVFRATFVSWVRFRSGTWTTRKHLLRVFCDNVSIRLSNATAAVGSLVGPPQPCHVYL